MVKKIFLLACLFSLIFTVPALAASSKAKLLTDTSSSANTVPYINAAPAEDSTAATALGVQLNGTEMMRVTASGRVGIGTASPGQKLSVAGTIESTSGGLKYPDGTTQATAGTASLNQNGYQKFPSGLIIQWGRGTITGTYCSYFAYPIAFPSALLSLTVGDLNGSVATPISAGDYTATGFSACSNASPVGFSYIAFGY